MIDFISTADYSADITLTHGGAAMTRARTELVSTETTPYYHVVVRCVRRAFLFGEDAVTGHSYEHRKAWVEERLLMLSEVFAIEVCAYAVMSNHYHVVLRLKSEKSQQWSQKEVIARWTRLYASGNLVEQFNQGNMASKAHRKALDTQTELWRQRLSELSWFMRNINEYIARKANAEDECTGRFWEGRFRSQALLDESALATCMAYVDLNPIRAKIAKTLKKSDYTSIKARIAHALGKGRKGSKLAPFSPDNATSDGLPFHLDDYLELVDWTGRAIRADKRGAISPSAHKKLYRILTRMGVEHENWFKRIENFEKCYSYAAGSREKLQELAQKMGQHWFRAQGQG